MITENWCCCFGFQIAKLLIIYEHTYFKKVILTIIIVISKIMSFFVG